MTSQKGRDLLLKIGNGGDPEIFTALGAARATGMVMNNQPVEATSMADGGFQSVREDGGVQSFVLTLDGLFRDAAAEEILRAASFDRTVRNYTLLFPNGDSYAAAFVVENYRRGGSFDGLESFSVTLLRSGGGIFTPGD